MDMHRPDSTITPGEGGSVDITVAAAGPAIVSARAAASSRGTPGSVITGRGGLVALCLLALSGAGCIAPPTEPTIPSALTTSSSERSDTLVVMLPGRGDRGDAFAAAGFEVPGLQHGFDSVAVDAHFGYYVERNLMDRLHDDVVVPALEQGYRNVWLLGTSMGGLGALLYAAEYPEQVDGLILLAPYLGDRRLIEAIVDAGGVAALGERAGDFEDYELDIWSLLLGESDRERPPVLLGYGVDDRMAEGYEAARDLIEPTAIYSRDGGHGWTTWRPLWDEIAVELESFVR
jgi:pimeloyl-ACP methyl ester carboxylesterase